MTRLSEQALSTLISQGESQTLEFKTSFNDEAIETIGAFANAEGGMLLIGVKDNGEIVNVGLGKKTVEDIANRIQDVTDPRLQPSLSVQVLEGKAIVVIEVTKMTHSPVSVRGRFYRRVSRTNQRMSHEEIMQRMVSGNGLSWDAYPEPGASMEDLDETLIQRFIEALKKMGRRPVPTGNNIAVLLQKLELVKGKKPTRAALLLFGKNPNTYFPAAFLKLGRFRSPTLIVDDREVHGSLIHQLDGAMGWFRARLTTEFIISGNPEREVRWEYPLSAIREALVNLLIHRDYIHGAHSQIRLYDDRLEFWNAGSLLAPLTPKALFEEHDSIPRNRKIAEIFFYMGLIERWGSGTLRIADVLETAGFPKPEFVPEIGRFRLVFHKIFEAVEEPLAVFISERQQKAVEYVKAKGSVSNSEYQQITGVSKRTASRELNDLVTKSILLPEGGSRGRGKLYRLHSETV